jgi:hypothetical protein
VRLVLIEWRDSFGCSVHWEPLDPPPDAKPLLCRSVGWLVQDGLDCKVVVPHITDGDHANAPQKGCGDMAIPTVAITRMIDILASPEALRSILETGTF